MLKKNDPNPKTQIKLESRVILEPPFSSWTQNEAKKANQVLTSLIRHWQSAIGSSVSFPPHFFLTWQYNFDEWLHRYPTIFPVRRNRIDSFGTVVCHLFHFIPTRFQKIPYSLFRGMMMRSGLNFFCWTSYDFCDANWILKYGISWK